MKKSVVCVFALRALGVGALVGCGGFEGDGDGDGYEGVNERLFCEKRDECDGLEGTSVEECIDDRRDCTDDLTPTERDEWNIGMDECAELSGCDPYFDCFVDVPYC